MDQDFLKTLANLYSRQYEDSQQRGKSFRDKLTERRQFVGNSEKKMSDEVWGSIRNGRNGVAINPVEALGDYNDYTESNFNKTRELEREAYDMDQLGLQALSGLLNVAKEQTDRGKVDQSQKDDQDDVYYDAVSQGIEQLQKGESWGTVWNRIKSRFPNKSANEIDADLGTDWRKGGAFEQFHTRGSDAKNPPSDVSNDIAGTIDELLREDTKPISGAVRLGGKIPGGRGQVAKGLYDKIKAMLSLDNRSMLKGSGAISDFEARVLEQAASELRPEMSDEDFRRILESTKNRLRGQAQGNQPASGNGYQPGVVQGLVNKYWGN